MNMQISDYLPISDTGCKNVRNEIQMIKMPFLLKNGVFLLTQI